MAVTDSSMIDIRPTSQQNVSQNTPRAINQHFVIQSASIAQRPSVITNGTELPPQGPTAGFIDESQGSSSIPFNQPSHSSSLLAPHVVDQPTTSPSKKTRSILDDFSDDDSIDGLVWPTPNLSAANLPTGLCYDVRMRYHCELDVPKQRLDFHPEDPRRIFVIYKELCQAGLVDDPMSSRPLVAQPLQRIPARNATPAEIALVHDRKYFEFLRNTPDVPEEVLIHMERQYDSVYFNKLTFASALLSAGGAIQTCQQVVSRRVKNAIAVIRPPGHHAECNRPMGFCLFDNVAVAAKTCQLEYPDACRKILIFDWDVHHGNGIQQAFYQDPNVLYISIHVHEDGNFYPSGPYGDHYHCGAGPGLGKNINVPWVTKGMGDADYLYAFQHVVLPVAYEFDPDLVIIAAGFDAAAGDPLGGCFVSATCYAHMTSMLMSLANGKIVACLEGGYNLKSISKAALAVTRTLMGEPPDRLTETTPTPSAVTLVQRVQRYQSRFWPCLWPREPDQELMNNVDAERMHDIIRYYQSAQLFENHKMICLPIFRDRLSKSFQKQILATSNYQQQIPLFVVFHDPPEIMGASDPSSQKTELHNTWLADGLKHYIDWAASQGLGVIDINVPKHLTDIDDALEENSKSRQSEIEDLAVYLWENYLDCSDATEFIFLGVGLAYHGIMHLLNERYAVYQRTSGVVHFIADEALIPISEQNVYFLSKWYRNNSLVFVAKTHFVWATSNVRKPSKRFGNLVASPAAGLNSMLALHQGEVQDFFMGKLGRRTAGEPVRKGSLGSSSAMAV